MGVAHAAAGTGTVPSGAEKMPGPEPAHARRAGVLGQGRAAAGGRKVHRAAAPSGGPDRKVRGRPVKNW